MANFFRSIDLATRSLLYSKFGNDLGINTLSGEDSENINKGVILFPKEIAQRIIAEKRGEYFLEFINFWRRPLLYSWERSRTTVGRRGLIVSPTDTTRQTVRAVPVDISYDIYFWSKSRDKVQDSLETYFFWQQTYPKMSITYNDTYPLELDLHFGQVSDQSPIDQIFTKSQYFVYTAPLEVDGWIFKSDDPSSNIIRKIQLTVYDKDDVSDITEIYVEDSNQDEEMEAALRMLRANLYGIESIDLDNNTLTIDGNFVNDFTVGNTLRIENSSDNNEVYEISSVTTSSGKTIVGLVEALASSTSDGNIYLHT